MTTPTITPRMRATSGPSWSGVSLCWEGSGKEHGYKGESDVSQIVSVWIEVNGQIALMVWFLCSVNWSSRWANRCAIKCSWKTSLWKTDNVDHEIATSPGRCFATHGELSKWVFVASHFRGWNYHPDIMTYFALEIRWRLRIGDTKSSSNF